MLGAFVRALKRPMFVQKIAATTNDAGEGDSVLGGRGQLGVDGVKRCGAGHGPHEPRALAAPQLRVAPFDDPSLRSPATRVAITVTACGKTVTPNSSASPACNPLAGQSRCTRNSALLASITSRSRNARSRDQTLLRCRRMTICTGLPSGSATQAARSEPRKSCGALSVRTFLPARTVYA